MMEKKMIAALAIASSVMIICVAAVCVHCTDDQTDDGATNNGMVVIVDGVRYATWDNGTAYVKMVLEDTPSITIPPVIEYEGKEYVVTCIDELSFAMKTTKEVHLPDTITTIGDISFLFSGVEHMTIPDSVKTIGIRAFDGCRAMESVSIPEGVMHIGQNAFGNCRSLTDIAIDEKNTRYVCENGLLIDKRSNELMSVLPTVEGHLDIPDLWMIAPRAFECSNVTSVLIPSSMVLIKEEALNCDTLGRIDVDPSNTAYSSVDGVLMDKDGCTLVKYPETRPGAYVIPDSVRTIAEEAFFYCTGLTSVTIPGTVRTIEQIAFDGCTSLTEITIGPGRMTIEDGAFFWMTFYDSVSSSEPLTMDQLPGYTYRGNNEVMYRV